MKKAKTKAKAKPKATLYLAPIKRIVHQAGFKIGHDALVALEKHLEDYIAKLARRSAYIAKKHHRKIIKLKHLKESEREGFIS